MEGTYSLVPIYHKENSPCWQQAHDTTPFDWPKGLKIVANPFSQTSFLAEFRLTLFRYTGMPCQVVYTVYPYYFRKPMCMAEMRTSVDLCWLDEESFTVSIFCSVKSRSWRSP